MVTTLQLQYLQLVHSDVLSRSNRCRLIKQYGSIDGILAADCLELITFGINRGQQQQLREILNGRVPVTEVIRQASHWLNEDREHRHLVCFEDPDYPALLKEIPCPPILLFVEGDVSCLQLPQLAVVGSRRSSSNGEQIAVWLAGELAKYGFCIASGLAAGIDSCAHNGALANKGRTLGVLGNGIDRIYPSRNRLLAKRITRSGALLSEFPCGTPPIPGNFPQRNRIIAGLSLGVIVIEATVRSGSLITARLAMETNREVFAIPGSIHNGNSRGCHRLIREGAKLVEDVDSVLEELAGPILGVIDIDRGKKSNQQSDGISEKIDLEHNERYLLELIGFDPCPAEVLAIRAGFSIDRISQTLSNLELKGYLQQKAGRYQRLASGLQQNSE